MNKCHLDKNCLDKCHIGNWHPFLMSPGHYYFDKCHLKKLSPGQMLPFDANGQMSSVLSIFHLDKCPLNKLSPGQSVTFRYQWSNFTRINVTKTNVTSTNVTRTNVTRTSVTIKMSPRQMLPGSSEFSRYSLHAKV